MTEELKQKARQRAKEVEAKQTLGIYDNDEDLARDEGWNDGYVSGFEEGYIAGATEVTKELQEQNELLAKHILELQKDKGNLTDRVNELNKLFANCDTCRRTCDIGNCCKFGNAYLPDTEKVLNKKSQLTEAKEIIREYIEILKGDTKTWRQTQAKAEAFLKE